MQQPREGPIERICHETLRKFMRPPKGKFGIALFGKLIASTVAAVLLLALAVNQKMSRSCCIISSLIALMPQQQSSLLVVVALSLDSQMSHVVDRIWVSAH